MVFPFGSDPEKNTGF